MKTLNTILLYISILFSNIIYTQNIERNEKSITFIVEMHDKDKNTLHTEILKSLTLLYNDANNVIQMNDKESGTIIIKGINKIDYLNFWWIGMPKMSRGIFKEYWELDVNHSIEINVKANKFRMIINFTSLDQMGLTYPTSVYELIDLRDGNHSKMVKLENETKEYLKKKVKLSNKKVLLCIDEMHKSVDKINADIYNFAYSLISNIKNDLESSKKDKW